jgi:hypothetical protein
LVLPTQRKADGGEKTNQRATPSKKKKKKKRVEFFEVHSRNAKAGKITEKKKKKGKNRKPHLLSLPHLLNAYRTHPPLMEANSALKTLFKEFNEINRVSLGYDKQATIEFPEGEENPLKIKITLTPNDGFFKSARIEFMFVLTPKYPNEKPASVKCLTKIFHPNIK